MSSYYEKFIATGEVKCIDDEIPFEIPATWEWARINTIGISQLGKTLDRGKNIGQEYPYLCSINVYWDGIDLSKIKTFKLRDDELPKYRLHKGDLLICEGGDYGRCCVWDRDEEMYYQNALHRIRFYCGLFPIFYKFVFELYRNIGYIVGQGQTIKHFTYESMKSIVFPVPSISEQKRIVELLKEVLYLVKRYDKKQDALNYLNERINVKLQKSILQEAIQGKLAPQIAEEGTAEKLLAEIRKEKERLVKEGKLKKSVLSDSVIYKGDDNKYYEQIDKETKEITEDILFDLPDKWQWCRIGAIFMHNNGKQLNKGNSKGKLMKYITTSNLYWDGFVLDNLKEMPFEKNEIDRCMAVKGDLLVCEGGDIGRSCIWNYDFPIMLQNHIHKLRPYIPLCTKFFYYIFNLYNLAGLIGGKGIGIQGFSSKALHNTLVPLPPLKEQYRIITQIEKLFEQLR
ncbi:restriction endonuclease subunit S [Bacteroides salyersiae]